jgi:hypothetical protein
MTLVIIYVLISFALFWGCCVLILLFNSMIVFVSAHSFVDFQKFNKSSFLGKISLLMQGDFNKLFVFF